MPILHGTRPQQQMKIFVRNEKILCGQQQQQWNEEASSKQNPFNRNDHSQPSKYCTYIFRSSEGYTIYGVRRDGRAVECDERILPQMHDSEQAKKYDNE